MNWTRPQQPVAAFEGDYGGDCYGLAAVRFVPGP